MKKPSTPLILLVLSLFFVFPSANAQEESEDAAQHPGKTTFFGGYGEVHYTLNSQRKTSTASLKRAVLSVGHKFTDKISIYTEFEMEDALVSSDGTGGGDFAVEEAYLKFDLNRPGNYILAGLFIPQIGLVNVEHLPNTFNGVNRPFVEQFVIPSTWRMLGVGYYGNFENMPNLAYSVTLAKGLNSAGFVNSKGIAGGRFLGSNATGMALALTASVRYYYRNFKFQASGYIGGSTSLEKRVADSLRLNSGAFANPVKLGEFDMTYFTNGWSVKALAAYIHISNAGQINRAFANNTPTSLYGAYGEIGYDFLFPQQHGQKSLILFGRYEYMNLSATLPANGIQNDANERHYIITGLTYKPTPAVAIKADYVYRSTGTFNQSLVVTPFPRPIPFYEHNSYINLGMAYSF